MQCIPKTAYPHSPGKATRMRTEKERDKESRGQTEIYLPLISKRTCLSRPQVPTAGCLRYCHPHKTASHLRATQVWRIFQIPFSSLGLRTGQSWALFSMLTRRSRTSSLQAWCPRSTRAGGPSGQRLSLAGKGRKPRCSQRPLAVAGHPRLQPRLAPS